MRPGTYRPKPIPDEALEMISDVLLASSPRDRERPTFDENQLMRRTKRVSSIEVYSGVETANVRLFEGQEEESIPVRLTPRQRLIWAMRQDGYSSSEIAAALGITRPTVVRALRNAAGIVATTRMKHRGLREVYRAEVRRKIYRKPDHCFEEACRKLGYCRYATPR